MKINTRLKLNSFISLGVLILILLSLGWSFREMAKATRNMDLAAEMRKTAFERTVLRDDYLLNHEERARIQWLAKSETLRELFKFASRSFTGSDDRALLKEAQGHFDATFTLFSRFLEEHKKGEGNFKKGTSFAEADSRLIGQVFLKAYALTDCINRLYESALKTRTTARDRGLLAVIVTVIGGMLMSIINTALTNRTFSKRIVELGKCVELIGSGDLDYRIGVEGDDELTALARAGNEMAAKLSLSYTAITDLEKEFERSRRTEEALQESERRLNEAQKMAQLGNWSWDVKSGVVEWSEEVYNIFHLDPNDFTPQIDSILALSPWPEEHERDKELLRKAMECHEKGDYEQRFLRPDGSTGYYYSTFQGKYDEDGNLISIIGTVLDITERKRAEETLKASEVRYRRLFEAARDGILILDAETGMIMDVNPFMMEMLDYSLKAFLGKKVWELGFFKNIIANQANFLELQQKEYLRYEDLPLETDDGRRIEVEFVSNVYRVNHKKVIQCNIRDITERKAAEAQIQRAMADLERSNKELEQFAYVASHDLQEPLRMVVSYTQLLAQRYEGQLDDKAKKFIDYAVDGAVRMQQLINDLLAYSRVNTQGKSPEMIDSHSVLGDALRSLSAAIEENRAIVTNDDLPMVRADPTQLSQLFQNLIGNAIKFHDADPPRIQVSASDLGREWQFAVKDNGIGIGAQYAEKVFVIFQRLHTRQEYPGTGIGLAICKRIVERHGGRIWFESEPGRGSIFYFTLSK